MFYSCRSLEIMFCTLFMYYFGTLKTYSIKLLWLCELFAGYTYISLNISIFKTVEKIFSRLTNKYSCLLRSDTLQELMFVYPSIELRFPRCCHPCYIDSYYKFTCLIQWSEWIRLLTIIWCAPVIMINIIITCTVDYNH